MKNLLVFVFSTLLLASCNKYSDLIGNKLQTTNETTLSLRNYSKGIYILKVIYGDRFEEVKVIKD